jgi:hypothetical protein
VAVAESQRSPEDSEQMTSMPQFEANEMTLPLSYAIYRMEQQLQQQGGIVTQEGKLAPANKTCHRPAPPPPSVPPPQQQQHQSSSHGHSHTDLSRPATQRLSAAEEAREAQLHLIEIRHRLRKTLSVSSPEESLPQRRFPARARGGREAEVEHRFQRNQWIRVGELLHLWRQRARAQRILRSVFSLFRRRWDDRLDRSRSDFLLLHTAFAVWDDVRESRRQRREQRQLTQRALVFRGMSLLTRGFTGWVCAVREVRRERQEQRVRVLIVLAQCWIAWMLLLKESREQRRVAVASYGRRLLLQCWGLWRAYLEYASFEQTTITTVVGYLQLRRHLQTWRLTLRYRRVLRLHGKHLLESEERRLRECFGSWLRCQRCRESVRRGAVAVEALLMKSRAKRCLVQWPGRDLTEAASALLSQVRRRRDHRRRELAGREKLIRGLLGAGEETAAADPLGPGVPVGETPPPSAAAVDPLTPPPLPSGPSATVKGAVVNSVTSLPHFQWIHLPASQLHPPQRLPLPSSQHQHKLHPAPFLIRPRHSIPPAPPHPLGYQNRAVQLGLSDGLTPTRALITSFLRLLLSLWRDHSRRRADIAKRGLFVRACARLRLLSKRFYEWISRSSRVSYRHRIWWRGQHPQPRPAISLFSSELSATSHPEGWDLDPAATRL